MASTPSATGATDARLNQLRDWLGTLPAAHGLRVDTLRPASADASFRRYFRLDGQAGTLIAMDAPPPQEDCRPFVHVAALLGGAGVHAPQVLEQDIAQGFLLLTDLGPQTYLQSLREANALPRGAFPGAFRTSALARSSTRSIAHTSPLRSTSTRSPTTITRPLLSNVMVLLLRAVSNEPVVDHVDVKGLKSSVVLSAVALS